MIMRSLGLLIFISWVYHSMEATFDEAKTPIASLLASIDEPAFDFSHNDIEHLFLQASDYLIDEEDHLALESARIHYHAFELEKAGIILLDLWQKSPYPNFSDNALLSKEEKKKTEPYLLPLNSPIKEVMDALFSNRVTLNTSTLIEGGFEIIASQPRSFIQVVRHPALPGYVLKLYLDDLLKKKQDIPGWKWFTYRCKGAKKIAQIIDKKNLKLITVPKKWIYPLPFEPKVPQNTAHIQKHSVLIAEEMPLVPYHINLELWKTTLTKQHLKELYIIISRAASVRPRPDNIWFIPDGRLALIDTEYANKKPDLGTIRPYLTLEHRKYWDKLVKRGRS